ncbi:hypothetical protein CC2G_014488 [Coprinopsis cinerea AmutBmut pab1-1]|nr:hypothetical protein CC2G_014488 [Coprinopsis cinerea AmutBmut pab1-1]
MLWDLRTSTPVTFRIPSYIILPMSSVNIWTANLIQAMTSIDIACTAIALFMWTYSVTIFRELTEEERSGRRRYLVISFMILACSCISAITSGIESHRAALETLPSLDNFQDVFESRYNGVLMKTSSVTLYLQAWIGDALLVYRCFIIWRDRLGLAVIPVLIYIASMGVGIRCLVPDYDTWGFEESEIRLILETVDAFIYLILHITITALIAYRLLSARNHLMKVLPNADDKPYTSIVAMFIESAAAITIFAAGYAITNLLAGWPAYQANSIFLIGYNACIVSIDFNLRE